MDPMPLTIFAIGAAFFVWLFGRQLAKGLKGPRKAAAWALFVFMCLPTLAIWGLCSWLLGAMLH
ncbi:MAG TPA: hypothetical protein VI756_25810 [Blastocatellia bacterium]